MCWMVGLSCTHCSNVATPCFGWCVLQVPLLYRMATVLDEKNPHAEKRSRYLWKTQVSKGGGTPGARGGRPQTSGRGGWAMGHSFSCQCFIVTEKLFTWLQLWVYIKAAWVWQVINPPCVCLCLPGVVQGKRQYHEYSRGRQQQQDEGYGDGDVPMKQARGPRGGRRSRRQQQGEGEYAEGDEAMHDVEVREGCQGSARFFNVVPVVGDSGAAWPGQPGCLASKGCITHSLGAGCWLVLWTPGNALNATIQRAPMQCHDMSSPACLCPTPHAPL